MPRNTIELLTSVSSKLLRQNNSFRSYIEEKYKTSRKRLNMPFYTHTETAIDLIYGFMVIDEDGNPVEGSWDYEPDEKILNASEITLIYFDSNFIPILGISDSHKLMDPCTEIYISLGQKLEAKPEWKEILKDFCSKNNIYFQDPEWIIGESHHSVRRHYEYEGDD